MDLLEGGALTGRGPEAALLTPVPGGTVHGGTHRCKIPARRPPECDYAARWATVGKLLEDAVQAARDDPADAQRLYNLCLVGCRTREAAERVLDDFIELGVPIDQLSHKPPVRPFA